jgi:hypothetical protein
MKKRKYRDFLVCLHRSTSGDENTNRHTARLSPTKPRNTQQTTMGLSGSDSPNAKEIKKKK